MMIDNRHKKWGRQDNDSGKSSAHTQRIKRVVLRATGSATQKDGGVSYMIRYDTVTLITGPFRPFVYTVS